jgi:hypothetical protein
MHLYSKGAELGAKGRVQPDLENGLAKCARREDARTYNEVMARGWESKAVESQIESAERRVPAPRGKQASAQDLDLLRKRESLTLSRTRVLRELETSQNPRYRNLMQKALDDLDGELLRLERGTARAATA